MKRQGPKKCIYLSSEHEKSSFFFSEIPVEEEASGSIPNADEDS